MARVLFIVDKPPLDEPLSFARKVTFSTRRSLRACAVADGDDEVHASYIGTKLHTLKWKFYIRGLLPFLNERLQNMLLTRWDAINLLLNSKAKQHIKKT